MLHNHFGNATTVHRLKTICPTHDEDLSMCGAPFDLHLMHRHLKTKAIAFEILSASPRVRTCRGTSDLLLLVHGIEQAKFIYCEVVERWGLRNALYEADDDRMLLQTALEAGFEHCKSKLPGDVLVRLA